MWFHLNIPSCYRLYYQTFLVRLSRLSISTVKINNKLRSDLYVAKCIWSKSWSKRFRLIFMKISLEEAVISPVLCCLLSEKGFLEVGHQVMSPKESLKERPWSLSCFNNLCMLIVDFISKANIFEFSYFVINTKIKQNFNSPVSLIILIAAISVVYLLNWTIHLC